jgi:2-C-methyl-D-erythritol 4-phosphate cytidylyltransferase
MMAPLGTVPSVWNLGAAQHQPLSGIGCEHVAGALGYPASMSVGAVVLAAGRGERFGGAIPKAFVPLAGKPMLLHALAAIAAARVIDFVVPVVARSELPRLESLATELAEIRGLRPAVVGGAERQDSVTAGLAALPPETELVAIHDAARPLVGPEAISRVVNAARLSGAAILGIPARDTIKRVRGGRILGTPLRSECYAAQTPQVFRVDLLREALEKAAADGFLGTDDSELVERIGVPVDLVSGETSNFKVTDAVDLAAAERWLSDRRAETQEAIA